MYLQNFCGGLPFVQLKNIMAIVNILRYIHFEKRQKISEVFCLQKRVWRRRFFPPNFSKNLLIFLSIEPQSFSEQSINVHFFSRVQSSWSWSAALCATYPRQNSWAAGMPRTTRCRHRSNSPTDTGNAVDFQVRRRCVSTRFSRRPAAWATCRPHQRSGTGPGATCCPRAASWASLVRVRFYWPDTVNNCSNKDSCSANTCHLLGR